MFRYAMKQDYKLDFVDAMEKEISDHEGENNGQYFTATLFQIDHDQLNPSGHSNVDVNQMENCKSIKLVYVPTVACKNGVTATGRHIPQ